MASNAAVVRAFYDDVWNKRHEAAIDAVIAPGIDGKMEGRDVGSPAEFKASWRELTGAFPDLRMTVEDVIEQGPKVAVRWRVNGTHTGPLAGLPATGRAVSARGLTWLELADGKIVRGWDSWNLGALIMDLAAGKG
ncbi:MAG: ester cyclase [Deltaproteobacteria bacterium]|nr:ester cyclase [Deltaproteobacteria bacterium]